jgi:hypothetical protein
MTDRTIHEYLDGDRSIDSLTSEERERAERLETSIAQVSDALAALPAPDLAARVMAAIPERGAPPRASAVRSLLTWLWSPRPVQVRLRPAFGMLVALVILGLGAALLRSAAVKGPVAKDAEAAIFVHFRVDAPGASEVALAGTFTGWEPSFQLRESVPGVWSVLVPLEPGVHDYVFVIDGTRWIPDPHAFLVDDSFGGTNSRLTLLPPTRGT